MPDSDMHIGLWSAYNDDGTHRVTLTLPLRWGSYLVAALAILVSIAGSSVWSIVAYAWHQRRVRPNGSVDPFNLQLQILLRNTRSAITAAVDAVKIHRAWPKGSRHRGAALLIGLAAVAILCAFAVAGVFVAAVASRAEEDITVLARPGTVCGHRVANFSDTNDAWSGVSRLFADTAFQARAYAGAWYAKAPSRNTPPSAFTPKTLPYQPGRGACPFGGGVRCVSADASDQGGALMLDAGFLDSHSHLGVNAAKENRLRLRIVATCSPLDVSEFTKPFVEVDDEKYTDLALGRYMSAKDNITFRISDRPAFGAGYLVFSAAYTQGATEPAVWRPIPAMTRTDATSISVYAIAQNTISYLGPVRDPLFSATGGMTITQGNVTIYLGDKPFNVLGCIEQHQFCNPNNRGCSDLTSLGTAYNQSMEALELNSAQEAVLNRTMLILGLSSLYFNGPGALGVSAFQANEVVLNDFFSPALPSDQWKREVTLWFQTGLARLQAEMYRFPDQSDVVSAPGVHVLAASNLTDARARDATVAMCFSQRTSSMGQVQNFDFAGLLVVVCVSTAIIVADAALEACVRRLRRWKLRRRGDPDRPPSVSQLRQLHAGADGMYRVLQAALDGRADGLWRKGGKERDKDIPVLDGRPPVLALAAGAVEEDLPFYRQHRRAAPDAASKPPSQTPTALDEELAAASPSGVPLNAAPNLPPDGESAVISRADVPLDTASSPSPDVESHTVWAMAKNESGTKGANG